MPNTAKKLSKIDVELTRHTSGVREIRWLDGKDWKDWKDGKDWEKPSVDELIDIIIPLIPPPIPWKKWERWPKGKDGEKWADGKDGKDLKFSDLTPYQLQILTWPPWNPWEWVARWWTTWQVLAKKSSRNFDTEWINVSGTGAVDSVNWQTGVVVLDADDIDDTSTTNKFVTSADVTKLWNLSGTNTGDQNSIVWITGTKAQFDTACTDGNFLYTGDALPISGGTITGNITLGENTSIALVPAGSADGKYSWTTITGTGGATIAFGDLVTLDKDDSRWELVDISVAAAATGDARWIIGIAVTSSTDGNPITVLLNGTIRADANFPALTIGAAVYASTTGDIVVAQPTTTDHVIRVVWFALTDSEIYFNPSNDFITHT